MGKKKKQKWVRFRHRVVRNLAFLIVGTWAKLKYRVKIQKLKKNRKQPYVILMNHQTAGDQFFLGMACKGPVYYVASEDLFSNGRISKLLRWAIAPIPIKKQTTDPRAVLTCMRVAKQGGTIAIFPEGNRTFSGKTEHVNPAIATLIKALKIPVAIFRLDGGYGVQPRWADKVRRGKLTLSVSRILEPQDYQNMPDDEFFKLLQSELYVDECQAGGEYKGKRLAEFMERAYYVCPFCGLSRFESKDDIVACKQCGKQVRYLPNKTLQGIDCEFPFKYTTQWYDYQSEFVRKLDLTPYNDTPMYEENVKFFEVKLYERKRLLGEHAKLFLYGNKMQVTGMQTPLEMSFEDIRAVTVLGRNKLNIYYQDKVFQCKGDKRFNAVKFVQIFYHWKNVQKGETNGEFLGL